MKIHTFIADSAPEAVAQIRAQLGPDAVVLNVRKVTADGLQRIWKKPQIEVLAHLPEEAPAAPDPFQAVAELRQELASLRHQMPVQLAPVPTAPEPQAGARSTDQDHGGWRIGPFLEQTGVLPRHAHWVTEQLQQAHGPKPPASLAKEFETARALLTALWPRRPQAGAGVHLFIGPPGSGKTTLLCKRLAQLTLLENQPARVFRLDGATANTAEALTVYCEILGVPVERCFNGVFQPAAGEAVFVDLPGVCAGDKEGLRALAGLIAQFPGAHLHLVLNAAYETPLLMQQVHAYGVLPVTHLAFMHLDEELRWGKLLNFVFGTNCSLSFLGAGQNVPGDLQAASAEKILSAVIPSK